MNNKEQYIKVSDIMEQCHKSAETLRSLADKCIESSGKGESISSSLGGAAYFLQQARIYEYDVPMLIKTLTQEELDETSASTETMPLEAVGFSTSIYNCLIRSHRNLKTLGDVTNLYLYELKKIRGLGAKSIQDILIILKKHNVKLKGSVE